MSGVALVGQVGVEVRVALPERAGIAVVQPRVAVVVGLVDRVSSPREAIAVGDREAPWRAAGRRPVALAAAGIAPAPERIPVPGLCAELRAQPVGERPEPRRVHRSQVARGVDAGGVSLALTVEAGSKCPVGTKRIDRVVEPHRDLCARRPRRGGRRSRCHLREPSAERGGSPDGHCYRDGAGRPHRGDS